MVFPSANLVRRPWRMKNNATARLLFGDRRRSSDTFLFSHYSGAFEPREQSHAPLAPTGRTGLMLFPANLA